MIGPVPTEALDRALNPARATVSEGAQARPLVFDPHRLVFLSGALGRVKGVLRQQGVRARLRDDRSFHRDRSGWAIHGATLRDYQQEVVESALAQGHGVIDIGTGGGKTLLAAAIIARLGRPALYLVTTRTLLAQAVRNLRGFLGFEPGVIGDGVVAPGEVTVALVQALDPSRHNLGRWAGGTLVFDEGHHAAASTYLDLIRRLMPRYHYYLSAVPFRSGEDQVVLDGLTGGSLTGGRFSARFLIEKGYACPVEVLVEHQPITGNTVEKPFAVIYRELVVENQARNARIAEIAHGHAGQGRSVLVLVEHVAHGTTLAREIGGSVSFVHGQTGRRALQEAVARFARGELSCLVATSGLFQEGVSIDGIEVLIQAGGLKSRAKVLQTVGRGMRRAPGKKACIYVDFLDDDGAGALRRHALLRLAVLKLEGFCVPPLPAHGVHVSVEENVQPSWAHVPRTKRFVRVDGDGKVVARGVCLAASLVPAGICKRCTTQEICKEGGQVLWRADQA